MTNFLAKLGELNFLYGVAILGFLLGSWFLGRAITVITKGQNPLIWKGFKNKDD